LTSYKTSCLNSCIAGLQKLHNDSATHDASIAPSFPILHSEHVVVKESPMLASPHSESKMLVTSPIRPQTEVDVSEVPAESSHQQVCFCIHVAPEPADSCILNILFLARREWCKIITVCALFLLIAGIQSSMWSWRNFGRHHSSIQVQGGGQVD
jgi:hypothetical protein